MKTLMFGKRTIRIPEKIAELSTEQLVRFVELQHAGLTTVQYNVWMMLNILDVNRRAWLKWYFFKNEYLIPALDKITFKIFTWKVKTIDPEDLYELCTSFPEFQTVDNFPLQNPFARLKIGGFIIKTLLGPTELLANLTFRQFRKAEEYYAKFLQKKDNEALNFLIAWLYIPEGQNLKFALHPDTVATRASSIANMPHTKKITILYFYLANREKVTKLYPYIYPRKKSALKSTTTVRSYIQIKRDLEKAVRILSPNINQDEETDFQDVHNTLAHWNDKAEEIDRIQEQIKANQK